MLCVLFFCFNDTATTGIYTILFVGRSDVYKRQPYILLYTKTSALELAYKALERMTDFLQDRECGMVYADHHEWKNGEKKKHPVNDYQPGSVEQYIRCVCFFSNHLHCLRTGNPQKIYRRAEEPE